MSVLTIVSGDNSNTRQSDGYVIITYIITNPVCFLSDCDILLSSNVYKNITEVTLDDSVLGYFSKQPQKIKSIIKNRHAISELQPTNLPCLIHKNKFGDDIPNKDIHLSGHHRIIFMNDIDKNYVGVQAFKMCKTTQPEQSTVDYYHIVLENKAECLVVNNLPAESCID